MNACIEENQQKGSVDWPTWEGVQIRRLDINKNEDLAYYLSQFHPDLCGRYAARKDALGLKWLYPTPHNWTTASTLVDLDSVTGASLYKKDAPIGKWDIITDLQKSTEAILAPLWNGTEYVKFAGDLVERSLPFKGYLNLMFGESKMSFMRTEAVARFFFGYIDQAKRLINDGIYSDLARGGNYWSDLVNIIRLSIFTDRWVTRDFKKDVYERFHQLQNTDH